MEYTVKSLAKLAGISSRTLRYYDEINLLKPCRVNSSGYRIYGEEEVDTLQQIMFYKEMGLPLEKIKEIISNKDFNQKNALIAHRNKLKEEQLRIEALLRNVEKTIKSMEGDLVMSNKEKFEGFKRDLIEKNEKQYGKEVREKYGNEAVDESNRRISKLSESEWNDLESLSKKVNESIKKAMLLGDSNSEEAREAVKLHKAWLDHYGNYSKEAHIGLGEMYVYDDRFKKYYEDNVGEGAAEFLRDAIKNYYNQ